MRHGHVKLDGPAFIENWRSWWGRAGALVTGQQWLPRSGPWQPGDYDGGERITRPRVADNGIYPYPYIIGCVSGFMPMQDTLSEAWAWGKPGFGPGYQTPVSQPIQQQFPTLPKVTG